MKKMLARLAAIVFMFIAIGGSVYAGDLSDVSIIQLIASPELFNEKKVRVIGFLHLEFEGNAVYLHREDFENSIDKNSIAIKLSDLQTHAWRKLNDHYVIIEGSFSSADKGHFGMRSGSLQQISRLSNWSVKPTGKQASEK